MKTGLEFQSIGSIECYSAKDVLERPEGLFKTVDDKIGRLRCVILSPRTGPSQWARDYKRNPRATFGP